MALIIENISGALLNVNDLGFVLTIGSTIDLSIENDPLTVSFSAGPGGDLNNLITSGSIVVKDPNDDVTNLSAPQGIVACQSHNHPTYQIMRLTGNVTQTANGVKLFLDRIIHGPASALDFIETGGGGSLTVGFQGPVSLVAPVVWTLPDADAVTSGDALTSNAAGILSWTTIASAPDQNLWETVVADTGSTTANIITDSLTIAGGTGISTTIVGDTVTIASTGGGGGTPGGVDSNVQYNNGGVFGGNSAFNFNDGALQVDILGNSLDTQLTVGGDAQVLSGETNATLYVEVDGGGLSDEAARFYWNRGAGISGWITYDYDGAAPSIRIVDEDDDPTSVAFQTVGAGTDLAPQFDNRFGSRGPSPAGVTTGFSWQVNNSEVAIMDTNFMDITSATGEYRVNGIPLALDNLSDVDTTTTTPVIGDALQFNGTNWVPVPSMRPTFCIFAEENAAVSVSLNNYEYSFGNGAVNVDADPSGIPMGVNCTLIGIGVSGHGTAGATTVSISITNNGTTVATGGIASATSPAKFQNFTAITPDTVNFVPGDTLQFITASETGSQRDVRVVAWFERTS